MKYRKKPVEIEAFQWTNKGNFIEWKSLPRWFIESYENGNVILLTDGIEIKTLKGQLKANTGDWTIKGIKGELYLCEPDIFEQTYDMIVSNEIIKDDCISCKRYNDNPEVCFDYPKLDINKARKECSKNSEVIK